MEKLTKLEFAEELKNRMEQVFDEVIVRETVKTNTKVLQLGVSEKSDSDGCTFAPLLSIDMLYMSYSNGETIDDIAREVEETLKRALANKPTKAGWNNNFKSKVFCKLINTELNTELLETLPHRAFADDLSIIYAILVSSDSGDIATANINYGIAEKYGLDEQELYDLAMKNTKELFPATVNTMNDILSEMGMPEEMIAEMQEDVPPEGQMYVISNSKRLFGASALAYAKEELRELADKLDSDLIILPSSIHEVIVLSSEAKDNPAEFSSMVTYINEEEVDVVDRLSDNVYYYSREDETIRLVS